MQNMDYYYDFSGQKFGHPLSLSINGFDRQVFSRQSSLEFSYVLKGSYEAITEHFTCSVQEHELIIIAPQEIHMLKQAQCDSVILTLHIDFDRFPKAMAGDAVHAFESMLCTPQQNFKLLGKLKHKLSELILLLFQEDHDLFQLNAIMMELVYIASNHQQYPIERLPLQSEHRENYMKAICFIDQHYQEDLHLENVADTLSFSISYTSKLFKKYTGIPFVKYLAYVRIRASLEALLEGRESIEQIASDCGMPNSKAYTTAFKELYSIVPSDYRKQFIRNMKFNKDKQEQVMRLDPGQRKLLAHLIADMEEVLYENAGVKISNQQGHLCCHIKGDQRVKTSIEQDEEGLLIEIIKR